MTAPSAAEVRTARGAQAFIPAPIARLSNASIVAMLVGIGFALRLYLCLTSYCIAGDGVVYVNLARKIAAGDYTSALASVFPPLYPTLIAMTHRAGLDFELGAGLISVAFGAATVAAVFAMVMEAFDSRELAIVAAAVTAIHPELARYGASVRTESGYIFMLVAAVWMALAAGRRTRLTFAFGAGAIAGVAYLYRTETVGLAIYVPVFYIGAAIVWRRWTLGWAIAAAFAFAAGFIPIAGPYVAYLSRAAGHLEFSRELRAAMMYGMADASGDLAKWQTLAYRGHASILAPMLESPRTFFAKLAQDFAASFYYFAEMMGPILTPILALGLWHRGRMIFLEWRDVFILLLIAGYTAGFAASYPGQRFMLHLVPLTFGWLAMGIVAASTWIARRVRRPKIAPAGFALAIGAGLIAIAVQPLGYDTRGIAEAGKMIASMTSADKIVLSNDVRFAYYAGGYQYFLPPGTKPDLCGWIAAARAEKPTSAEFFVALTDKEEPRFGDVAHLGCLRMVHRFPRGDRRHYDLFATVK